MFEDSGIKYENQYVDRETWPTEKKRLLETGDNPFGQLPVVEHNGKTLFQSTSIFRYYAKKLNLHGSNDEEEYLVDNLHDCIMDSLKDASVLFGSDEAAKTLYWSEKAIPNVEKVEKVASTNGRNPGPYFLGPLFSWVDILIFQFVHIQKSGIPDFSTRFPFLTKVASNVAARPNIASYLSSDSFLGK